MSSGLVRRDLVDCVLKDNGRTWDCTDNGWMHRWGRWAMMGGGIAGLLIPLIAFYFFAKISAKKRARAGLVPYVGTQWAYPKGYEVHQAGAFVDSRKRSSAADQVELGGYGRR